MATDDDVTAAWKRINQIIADGNTRWIGGSALSADLTLVRDEQERLQRELGSQDADLIVLRSELKSLRLDFMAEAEVSWTKAQEADTLRAERDRSAEIIEGLHDQLGMLTNQCERVETERDKLRGAWLDLWEIFSDGEGADIDSEAFLTVAQDAGIVVQEPYDPDSHGGDMWGDPEPGDPIYLLAPPYRVTPDA
jgi:hypothetical protein